MKLTVELKCIVEIGLTGEDVPEGHPPTWGLQSLQTPGMHRPGIYEAIKVQVDRQLWDEQVGCDDCDEGWVDLEHLGGCFCTCWLGVEKQRRCDALFRKRDALFRKHAAKED